MTAAHRVVGIDPSLAGTGVASVDPSRVDVDTFATTPTTQPTFIDRDQRLQRIADMVARYVGHTTDLVVIEGPALAKASPHTWDRAGLWWRIVHRLHVARVPVAVCPPTVRAKWATGKGNAGKSAVVAAIARMWPSVPLANDNVADALALATMAAQRLDLTTPIKPLARHRDALDGVAWPDMAAA